jgi:hypothetical protein
VPANTYDTSVGERTGYHTRWVKIVVTKPSYYILCFRVSGAPVEIRTFKEKRLQASRLLTHSEVVEGSTAATTLSFSVHTQSGQHSDVSVRLTLNEKTEAGFKRTQKTAHTCP